MFCIIKHKPIRLILSPLNLLSTGDVAHAARQYVSLTRDKSWLNDAPNINKKTGYDLLLEAARFWISRATPNKFKKFDINGMLMRYVNWLNENQAFIFNSGGSRISRRGRGPVGGGENLRCRQFSMKMYAKMKELGPVGGVCWPCPLDPPMFNKKMWQHLWCWNAITLPDKIYSVMINSFLINSFVFLAKIPFDSMSFTWLIDRGHQFCTEAIGVAVGSIWCWW